MKITIISAKEPDSCSNIWLTLKKKKNL